MESLLKWMNVLHFTKDENKIQLECFQALQKLMNSPLDSLKIIENLNDIIQLNLALIESSENPKQNEYCDQNNFPSDKKLKHCQKLKNNLFHLGYNFIISNNNKIMKDLQENDIPLLITFFKTLHKLLLKCSITTNEDNCLKYVEYLLGVFDLECTDDRFVLNSIDSLCNYLEKNSTKLTEKNQNSLLNKFENSFQKFPEQILAEIFLSLIPKLLNKSNDQAKLIRSLWSLTFKFQIQGDDESTHDRCLFIACGLSDVFFGTDRILESRREFDRSEFIKVVKQGLRSSDVLARKRGLFLLRRILDFYRSDGSKEMKMSGDSNSEMNGKSKTLKMSLFWEDFVLIMETLEETQFHLIQPVLKIVNLMSKACSVKYVDEVPPTQLMPHQDWLLIILKRMMDHDCILVKRHGVSKFLTSVHISPENICHMTKFFCDQVLNSLQDSSLYYRSLNTDEKNQDSCPEQTSNDVTEALGAFFKGIDLENDDLGSLLTSLLVGISSRSWNGSILCNFLKSMGCLRQEHFLHVADVLPLFRTLFSKTISAFDSKVKDVTRFYLANLMTHLINPDSIDPFEIINLASIIPYGVDFLGWKKFIDWTSKCLKIEEAEFEGGLLDAIRIRLDDFLKSPCLSLDGAYSLEEFTSEAECSTIVRLILLIDKALELKFKNQDSPFRNKLTLIVVQPLEEVLSKLIGHAYLSENKIHWVLMLLLAFLSHLEDNHTLDQSHSRGSLSSAIWNTLHSFRENIVTFASRKFIQKKTDYSFMRLYLESIRSCFLIRGNVSRLPLFEEFIDWSVGNLKRLNDANHGKLSSIHLVSMEIVSMAMELQPVLSEASKNSVLNFLSSQWRFEVRNLESFEHFFIDPKKLHLVRDHMFISQLTMALWLLTAKRSSSSSSLLAMICDFMESCMECGSMETCQMCCRVLRLLLKEVDPYKSSELISLVWKKIQECSKQRRFLDCFRTFVTSVFDLEVIDLNDQFDEGQQVLLDTVVGVASDVFVLSEERPKLLSTLVKVIYNQVKVNKNLVVRLVPLVPFLTKAVVFGPLQDRSTRFRDDLLRRYQEDCLGLESFTPEDQSTRLTLLQLLISIQPISHEQSLFGFSLLDELLANYRETLARSSRCYGNSVLHRCKHRMMVAIFSLEKFAQVKKGQVIKFLLEVPALETQPSVRFLSSWLLIRLIGDAELKCFQSLLRTFEETDSDKTKKPSLMTSMFNVISHVVSRLLGNGEVMSSQHMIAVQKYLDILLTWSTTPQSSIRIAAQASVLRLSDAIRQNEGRDGGRSVEGTNVSFASSSCLLGLNDFLVKNRSTYRHAFQLLDSIYYKFGPWTDFSMEAITHYTPLLTSLTSDECFHVHQFDPKVESVIPIELDEGRRKVWESCLQSGNIWKDTAAQNNSNVNNNNGTLEFFQQSSSSSPSDNHHHNSDNVQKKITPWKEMILSGRRMDGGQENDRRSADEESRGGGGLILVASLVDRIPNLGGLCRTCEIFGTSKMVVDNLRVVNDVNFEKLSVTAHKWMDIEEVTTRNLSTYLSGLAREGYTIVALEQTSKSIPLHEYKFPKKCAVVLGNEKSGIPVEIIQLMEVCLEIPQHGIIRSLNVHVSGALLMWEYFKQKSLLAGTN